MYIIIAGGGDFGFYLAKLLVEEEHEVVVIEKEEEKARYIADELDIITIIDDATKPDVLKDAGINNADALVALTDSDETNLVVGMLAKELGAKKVAVRLTKINYNKKFLEKLGIDVAFHPEAAAAGYLAEMLTKPDVLDLAFLSKGHAEIIELEVKKGSKLDGKKLSNINIENGSVVALFDEDGNLILPEKKLKLKAGYKILIIAKTEQAKQLRKMLNID